jgi:hypothetical protein
MLKGFTDISLPVQKRSKQYNCIMQMDSSLCKGMKWKPIKSHSHDVKEQAQK